MSLFCPVFLDIIPKGLTFEKPYADLRCIPDKTTFRKAPWSKNQGVCFVRLFDESNKPFEACPRHLLEKAIGQLKDLGYTLKVGIEIEYTLLKKDTLEPYDNSTYYSLHSMAMYSEDIENLIKELEAVGIKIEQIHKEGAKGQFELVLKYDEIMRSIDNYYMAKEILACYYAKKGYYACFLPKVFSDCSNGAHTHMSLWKDGKNVTGEKNGRYGLSQDFEYFLAGILKSLNVLVHFMAPSPNSKRRIKPNSFCGGYKFWGRDNREAPIKVITPMRPGDQITHFELKSFDNTCNQYFALAAVIACGIKGLKEKMQLPAPYDKNADDISAEEREKLGIKPLPLTFNDQKAVIEGDEGAVLREFFGPNVISNILKTH